MTLLVLGLVLFLGIHSVAIVAPRWRQQRIAASGEGPWKIVYSIVSAIGLVLIVVGFGRARMDGVILWHPPQALRHFALLLMVPVFPLLLAAYFPGRIQRATRHPMLLATKVWATAHLLANGMLADVVLFGAFLAWAIADRIAVKRRLPSLAHATPGAPPRPWNDAIAIIGGLVIYAVLIMGLHRWLFGVSPIAF